MEWVELVLERNFGARREGEMCQLLSGHKNVFTLSRRIILFGQSWIIVVLGTDIPRVPISAIARAIKPKTKIQRRKRIGVRGVALPSFGMGWYASVTMVKWLV